MENKQPEKWSEDIINDNVNDDIDPDLENKRYGEDTRHRSKLVNWVIVLVSGWMLFVASILFLNKVYELELNTEIIITLLTTTTINILGLPIIVLKGLFKE